MPDPTARDDQDSRTVALVDTGDDGGRHEVTPTRASRDGEGRSQSLWADARRKLLRDPVFIVAALVVLTVASMAAFPQLWTSTDPAACQLANG